MKPSMPATAWPRSRRVSQRWEPMNPAAPVTAHFMTNASPWPHLTGRHCSKGMRWGQEDLHSRDTETQRRQDREDRKAFLPTYSSLCIGLLCVSVSLG